MNTEIRVKNLKEINRDMRRLGVESQDMKGVYHDAGNEIKSGIQPRVPVRSGKLAASLRAGKTASKAIVRAGSKAIPYAGVQNFGGYNNIEGQHFMEQGLEEKTEPAHWV